MNDEPKNSDEGILGRARRLADQVGEYARSHEAREKLDGMKKNAIKAGGMASAGAKKLVEGTRQAAEQAIEKADEFSKSETAEALRGRANQGLIKIKGILLRDIRPLESPVVIGLSLLMCFPVGLVFVWRHPAWSTARKGTWTGAYAVAMFLFLIIVGSNQGRKDGERAFAEAEALWATGDRAGAVAKYRDITDMNWTSLDSATNSIAFGRTIGFDVEKGDIGRARSLMKKALEASIPLTDLGDEAAALLVSEQLAPGTSGTARETTGTTPSDSLDSGDERLTADYLFHAPGVVLEYVNEGILPGGSSSFRFGLREVQIPGGLIEITTSALGGSMDGHDLDAGAEAGKKLNRRLEHRRVQGGFVEIGKQSEFDPSGEVVWERVLKLDARKGDSWDQELTGGLRLRTTLVDFARFDNRICAVIVRDSTMDPTGDSPSIVARDERKYVKGIGLIESTIRSKIGDGEEQLSGRRRLVASTAVANQGNGPRTPTIENRRRLLEEAGSLWEAGDADGAAKNYYAFRKTWGDQMPRLIDEEKKVYGDRLPLYYSRMIERSIRLYRNDHKRYAGMIKVAQEVLDNAAENGIVLPSRVARSVREARDAPIEEKSFKVGKGFGRGSLVVELPTDYDAGIALKDLELTDHGSLEFTLTWFPERNDEPARRWSAYDDKGVSLVNGVISYGQSIRGREPTRASILLGPNVWRKVKAVKIE